MKKRMFVGAVIALFVLVGAGFCDELGQEPGALAGEINLVMSTPVAGGDPAVVKSGIQVIFLTVTGDGPQDVDSLAPGQERVEATTDADGFYFIDNIDPAKSYQIRRIVAQCDGKPVVYNPSYFLDNRSASQVLNGKRVFWHKLVMQYAPKDGVSGLHQATGTMTDEDVAHVKRKMGADVR